MKTIILNLIFLLGVGLATAQEGVTPGTGKMPTDPGQVPSLVMERFNKEYPGVSGNWSKEEDNYRVEFTDPKSRMLHVIIYDRNGEVIRRENELDNMEYPGAINDYNQKNYPGEQLRIWSAEEKNGEKYFYTKRQSEVLKYDKDGQHLVPKDKSAGNKRTDQNKAQSR
jgi:hypothetical protein